MANILKTCTYGKLLPSYNCLKLLSRTLNSSSSSVVEEDKCFGKMFKETAFAKLGRPYGKIVDGKIIHIVKDDLYIDFGWKFHAVVKRPSNKSYRRTYEVGDAVEVKINDLELTGHFLGQYKRITLCEADVCLHNES